MDRWAHSSATSKLNFLSFEHCVVFMQENIPWINNAQYFGVKEHRIFNCSEIVQEKKKKRKTTTHEKWNMNRMKRQKRHWKMNPRVSRCPTGYWRRAEKSLQEEEMGPMQKQRPAADVTGDGSQVQRCKEQYCTGTWNVRSVNQGKLEVVKQEMARVNRHFRNQWAKMDQNGRI